MTIAEIIIIRYNQPELEVRCIGSVQRHTNLKQHRLTVVDNYTRDKNLGALWNELIAKSTADFIMLLNSDTEVEEGWLDKLIAAAEHTEADAVGPMTDNCGIWQQKGPRDKGTVQVDQLSGFCLLLHRSALEKAGGFREDFPFYGQESNLMRRIGRKIICRDVFVHHEAGASVKACKRKDEERELIRDVWKRNIEFRWKHRLAVIGCDDGPGNPFPLWRGIDQAMVEFAREGMVAKHFGNSTVTEKALRYFDPSVIIVVSQRWKTIERVAKTIKSLSVRKGIWFNDLRDGVPAAAFKGAFHKIFLCFNNSPAYSWANWKAASGADLMYMPQGSIINTELEPLRLQHESLFIGGLSNTQFHSDRRAVVETLGTVVMNSGDRPKRIEIERQSAQLYRSARFCLAMSPNVPGYSSIRLYNIMALGGLPLVARFNGMEKMFEDGRHALSWTTATEAAEVMERWKDREDECERIRKRAWRLQQAKHTVGYRLLNMVANLTTDDQGFWGYLDG